MRLPPDTLAGLAEGRIDLAFRRWEKPRVKPGGRQRTPIGVVGFETVEAVPRRAVTVDAARRAGFADRDEVLAFLDRRSAGQIYRIQLGLVGPDPRVALREERPDAAALAREMGETLHDALDFRRVLEPGGPVFGHVLRLPEFERAVRAGVGSRS